MVVEVPRKLPEHRNQDSHRSCSSGLEEPVVARELIHILLACHHHGPVAMEAVTTHHLGSRGLVPVGLAAREQLHQLVGVPKVSNHPERRHTSPLGRILLVRLRCDQ